MRLDEAEARQRFERGQVARLSTVDEDGQPHLVPIVFTIWHDEIVFAVDDKPKRGRNLKRLRNIAVNPRVSLLVDEYAEDWSRLWWVRADGRASIRTEPAEIDEPIDALVAKYPQYQRMRPAGPVVRVAVDRWTGWAGGR